VGAYVFNNQIFDSWLDKMSDEILSKVNREKITTEEMIILILKAQTNHFHHMDVDLNHEIKDIRSEVKNLGNEIKDLRAEFKSDTHGLRTEVKAEIQELRTEVKAEIQELRTEVKAEIQELRTEFKSSFEKIDAKMDSRFMWSIGVTITMSLGLYIKLFLG
jgi:predicted  nucleic acid-binding Zn-ribbon protein